LPRQDFAFVTGGPPTAVDWRDAGRKNFVTHVGDQGQCGACVAFAACAVLESRAKIHRQDAHYEIELSKAHLFFCGVQNGCENGWTPGLALKRCRDRGVGREANFRYQPRQIACREIDSIVHVLRWRRPSRTNDRKEALWLRGPVIGCMVVYSDFLWYRGGVYRPVTSEVIGLHCVAVIGFDDERACWLIKNSWGSAWGEGGFVRMGYGACGVDAQFPFYDPVVAIAENA
jgi:C1A family cysteine protease